MEAKAAKDRRGKRNVQSGDNKSTVGERRGRGLFCRREESESAHLLCTFAHSNAKHNERREKRERESKQQTTYPCGASTAQVRDDVFAANGV